MTQAARRKAERFLSHLEPIQSTLSAYCTRALSDNHEVADALQSALANAYRDFDLYAEGTNFRAWMFQYVSYEVRNRNRAAARRQCAQLPHDVSAECTDAGRDELLVERLVEEPEIVLDQCEEAIAQAVLDLPDAERDIFLLRAIGQFTYREIAEILEVPVGTVMGRLSRSRDRLRRSLAEYAKMHRLLPGSDSQ